MDADSVGAIKGRKGKKGKGKGLGKGWPKGFWGPPTYKGKGKGMRKEHWKGFGKSKGKGKGKGKRTEKGKGKGEGSGCFNCGSHSLGSLMLRLMDSAISINVSVSYGVTNVWGGRCLWLLLLVVGVGEWCELLLVAGAGGHRLAILRIWCWSGPGLLVGTFGGGGGELGTPAWVGVAL